MLNKAQHDQMIQALVGLRFITDELLDTLKTISIASSNTSESPVMHECNKSNIFNDYCIKVSLGTINTIPMNYKIFYLNTNQKDKILITDTEYISNIKD